MNPVKKKLPAIAAAKRNKNIVSVGRLKEIVANNEARIGEIEAKRKALGYDAMDMDPIDQQDQEILSQLSMQNKRYGDMIKNPSRFKPKAIVKAAIIKKLK